MKSQDSDSSAFFVGTLISFVSHLLFAAFFVVALEASSVGPETHQVFSVTLEGGASLGGINQAPDLNAKETKVLPNQLDPIEESSDKTPTEVKEKQTEIEKPTLVEDPEKILEAKKKEEEKKKLELKKIEDKKKAEEKKKKDAEEAKLKAEDAKKKAEEEKVQQKKEKEARDKALAKAIQNAKKHYHGESANAGGQGFGAAATGGKGMGGGTLQSLEFVAYRNALERHIKGGWRWLPSPQRLRAVVWISILPTGEVINSNIAESSGNSNFDESVLRAVIKASPVPPAPTTIYQDFREIRITFDSQE